jgi:hypothetical protein
MPTERPDPITRPELKGGGEGPRGAHPRLEAPLRGLDGSLDSSAPHTSNDVLTLHRTATCRYAARV